MLTSCAPGSNRSRFRGATKAPRCSAATVGPWGSSDQLAVEEVADLHESVGWSSCTVADSFERFERPKRLNATASRVDARPERSIVLVEDRDDPFRSGRSRFFTWAPAPWAC